MSNASVIVVEIPSGCTDRRATSKFTVGTWSQHGTEDCTWNSRYCRRHLQHLSGWWQWTWVSSTSLLHLYIPCMSANSEQSSCAWSLRFGLSWSADSSNFRQKGAIAIRQPYLRVVGMEQATDAHSVGGSAYTDEVRQLLNILFTQAQFAECMRVCIFNWSEQEHMLVVSSTMTWQSL